MDKTYQLPPPRWFKATDNGGRVDPKTLKPGTLTFTQDPHINRGHQFMHLFVYPAIFLIIGLICVGVWVKKAPPELADSLLCQAIVIAPGALLSLWFTVNALKKLQKEYRTFVKIVLYQPGAHESQQPYRREPASRHPRYEIHYNGEVKDQGIVTHENLVLTVRPRALIEGRSELTLYPAIGFITKLDRRSMSRQDPFCKVCDSSYYLYESWNLKGTHTKQLLAAIHEYLEMDPPLDQYS